MHVEQQYLNSGCIFPSAYLEISSIFVVKGTWIQKPCKRLKHSWQKATAHLTYLKRHISSFHPPIFITSLSLHLQIRSLPWTLA